MASLHDQWRGRAVETWPWLPRASVSDLVETYFAERWPVIRERADLTDRIHRFGDTLVGKVKEVEGKAAEAGPHTLTHGDASARNMRTSASGEVALLDWEDFGTGPGICDVAWFLVSSVEPEDWDGALDAYGDASKFVDVLPVVAVQGLLSLDNQPQGSVDATSWVRRLDAVSARLGAT